MFNKEYFEKIIDVEPQVRIVGFDHEVIVNLESHRINDDFITFKIIKYNNEYLGFIDVAYEHIISVR